MAYWYKAVVDVSLTPRVSPPPEQPPPSMSLVAGVYPRRLWALWAAKSLNDKIPKAYRYGYYAVPIEPPPGPYPYPVP